MFLKFSIILVFISFLQLGFGQKTSIKDTIYITQCDTGTQGQMVLDLESIKNSVFSKNQLSNNPTIYIATQGGSVIKIENILTTLNQKNVCLNLGESFTDIAINKDKEIYLCSSIAIYKLDTTACTLSLFYNVNPISSIYALSFDTKNNLYYSDGTKVYRFNNTTGTPVLWHDFGSGYASGDFVMKNGKMYIAWVIGSGVRLYEINVDNNINYVSHTDKCSLKLKTYGLASELGQLYGVTPTELYKIDDNLCQNTTILSNTGNAWYGAAGLHEAQNSITAHLTYSDAILLTNQIKGNWTNTIPFNQLIYLTIDDKIKDSLFIYPVKIKIKPKLFSTINKTICKGSNYAGYSSSGTYLDKFKDNDGCDSMRTLILSVVNNIRDTIRVSICQGQYYKTYTNTGFYIENYKTTDGCDSILCIDLKVNLPTSFTLNQTICNGKIFMGKSTAGTYTFNLINKAGCDSILTLNLAIVSIPKPFINKYACINLGQSFRFLSKIINSAGTYIDSTNHIEDCDTIFRLTVSLIIPKSDTLKSTQCQYLIFKGSKLVNDTFITETVKSYLGCDSIYRLHDIQVQKLYTPAPILNFYCDTFQWNSQIFSSDTILYISSRYLRYPYCDSFKQKFVFTKAPKSAISIHASTGNYCIKGESISLEAKGGLKYLWNTMETNAKIIIKPTYTSTYLVQGWDQYNCIDTASIEIEVEDLVTIDVPKAFSPNGDGLNDFWSINSNGKYEILNLDIFNRWGEKVFSSSALSPSWNGNYKGKAQPNSVYTFIISLRKNRQIYEKTGELMLVR